MVKYDVAKYNLIYIYAISDDAHNGLLKIGQTSFSSPLSIAQLTPNCPTLNQHAHLRISQQTKTAIIKYELLHAELATRTITMQDGSTQIQSFEDHDVHDVLLNSNFSARKFVESGKPSEWYEVDLESAKAAITAVKQGRTSLIPANIPAAIKQTQIKIKLRHEQEENVKYTIDIFNRYDTMLWDCKMRYGKTVTAYELIKRQGYQKVIVITHRPAVEDSWGSDHELMFAGTNHLFIDKTNGSYVYDGALDAENDHKLNQIVKSGIPFVYFASIQDLRGSQRVGGKYNKNNAVFDMSWDLLIIDEAHEGTATDLGEAVIKAVRKPNTKVLSLSGTPYNIMGDFAENKYTWTYVDEQKAKVEWEENHPGEKNPYEELPKMNIFTFDLTEHMANSYRYVTEDSAFNFREFFRTWTGDIDTDFHKIPAGKSVGDFVYEEDVYNFLSLISKDDDNSNYPFSNDEYREMFAHTFWLVPGVKEAKALSALIKNHPNFKGKYEVVNIAGEGDEETPNEEALALVRSAIKSFSRTITISCDRLTTGVTVREWTAIMMLSGSSSTIATRYMQSIFRVQSPGYINGKQKKNCYVFDFAPDRTLKVIADVHRITHKGTQGDEKAKQALGEFINFCPVIAVDGSVMRSYDVNEMMRQIKKISIDAAINSGFDDDTIYITDAGMQMSEFDVDVLRKLSDVVIPQKKGNRQKDVPVAVNGFDEAKRKLAKKAERKPKSTLTQEEKEALELLKKQKEEQKKMFNLLRAVSIRLPLLFYGAEADITEIIHLKDFVNIVDEESWEEFMPQGLKKALFLDILKYYDEDIVAAAGLRIRKLAKAADELPPTRRAKRIVEIMSKFKNPDKETVLTPWRVVNMHMGNVFGGYNFYDEQYNKEVEEPRVIDKGDISADVFLNSDAKILEMNSKSGLYPLYLAYSFYMLNVSGKEKDLPIEQAHKIWFDTLEKHIYVLCKTKMARMITIRTLAGYSKKTVNAIYLTKLIDERMKDLDRLSKKLTNPNTWNQGGERMKFDAVVGNPPYQGVNHQQIYPYFYLAARQTSNNYVSLIFPTGWQEPKNANNLSRLNNPEVKADKQIVFIDNRQNVFPGIAGAEWTNIILWKKNFDNELNGSQMVYTNGLNSKIVQLLWDKESIVKPEEIVKIDEIVKKTNNFVSVDTITTGRKPFPLTTKSILEYSENEIKDCLKVYSYSKVQYLPTSQLKLFKDTAIELIKGYKVFIPYAWGNWSNNYLGGAYADIFVAGPNTLCLDDTYLVAGPFATKELAYKHAKYLMTHFARALLYVNKYSQHSTTSWNAIPMQDFSEDWWDRSIVEIDKELVKKYNIPSDIAEFIEKNIQTKDETNIINY